MDFQNYFKQLQLKAAKMTNEEWTVYIENMIKLQDKIYSETADEELLTKCIAESAAYFLVKHICKSDVVKRSLPFCFKEECRDEVRNIINNEREYNNIIENNHIYIGRTALQIDNLKKYQKTQEENGKPFNRDEFNEFLGFSAIYYSILKEKTEDFQKEYEIYEGELLTSLFMQIDREYFPCVTIVKLTTSDDNSDNKSK